MVIEKECSCKVWGDERMSLSQSALEGEKQGEREREGKKETVQHHTRPEKDYNKANADDRMATPRTQEEFVQGTGNECKETRGRTLFNVIQSCVIRCIFP